jgi:hypothetical protein
MNNLQIRFVFYPIIFLVPLTRNRYKIKPKIYMNLRLINKIFINKSDVVVKYER